MSELEIGEKIGKVEARLLYAYIDRELNEQSRQEVEEILRLDQEALRFVIEAKKFNTLTRMALDAELNTPEAHAAQAPLNDQLIAYQRKSDSKKLYPQMGIVNHPYFAIAATLVLLFVGYQIGSLSLDFKVQQQLIAMETEKNNSLRAIDGERNRVLEYIPSGQTEKWQSENGYIRAELMPIRTLRTENNRYCREYKEVLMQNEKSEVRHVLSCRVDKEAWKTKLILFNGEITTM
ncbi:MAG: hypothetical protein KDI47_15015 [Gammaproteobacteria bacterium]|nr:hypothetical protein [Gammaproteobacteria bacterium]MCB1863019.1 hypothetical protein [Gammaproteobacteria bacterium]MCB1881802.1 hypothetical protein [Gammaproteobacteria bacterium]